MLWLPTAHPLVSRVAVPVAPDDRLGERVAACIVSVDGARPATAELIERLRPTPARYKIPEVWEFVEDPALTGTGKMTKDVLVRDWLPRARARWTRASAERPSTQPSAG